MSDFADHIKLTTLDTDRLERELDITNADHIALWLEANVIPHDALRLCLSWLSVQIVEAHERAIDAPTCPNCEAQANTIEELRAANERWAIAFKQAEADANDRIEALQADKAKMCEALKQIARYDVGLQALIEDGADTPENRAKYYEGRVEYRRSIALAALQETGQ